jgi:hypothetical protein
MNEWRQQEDSRCHLHNSGSMTGPITWMGYGLKFPPLIKLRLAHHHEITAYAAENAQVEIFD